ncbi:adaptor protein MecA [Limosilactobacillus caecicola]|uniref:adaptor protein MecA n=1 Tax=Limosilactobacillus caecicola TaxID=2941332 RepID=UPI00203D5518|nr:adaptor protein MecA [Limosilactobacillus caecicola]
MEKKRLDENTIQVIIDQNDLDERGITMLDLIGNQNQIEDFFYSILAEVDTDHQFKKNDSVTFQALPIKDGLELIISKNVRPQSSTSEVSQISQLIADQLKEHDHDQQAVTNNVTNPTESEDTATDAASFVVRFADFEDFIQLSGVLNDDELTSDLYLLNGHYYLMVQRVDNEFYTADSTLNERAIAAEYGDLVEMAPAVLQEHAKLIMSQSALDTAKYYFK